MQTGGSKPLRALIVDSTELSLGAYTTFMANTLNYMPVLTTMSFDEALAFATQVIEKDIEIALLNVDADEGKQIHDAIKHTSPGVVTIDMSPPIQGAIAFADYTLHRDHSVQLLDLLNSIQDQKQANTGKP